MRIIAGSLKGRQFDSPRGQRTHPMSDKMRGALFNALGDLGGLTVLDAFAGSGALSFEAISRGAAHATAIERDRSAQVAIGENIAELRLKGQIKLIKARAASWLSTTEQSFDIVLLDPPYEDPQLNLLGRLAELAKPGGLVVASLAPETSLKLNEKFRELVHKDYGDSTLIFYRRA